MNSSARDDLHRRVDEDLRRFIMDQGQSADDFRMTDILKMKNPGSPTRVNDWMKFDLGPKRKNKDMQRNTCVRGGRFF